jgi:hypothetical protein
MFKISTTRPVKTLRPGDADFTFSPDGIQLVTRAGFEISKDCPYNHLQVLQTCIDRGWIKPVACMRDVEYTMELLRK